MEKAALAPGFGGGAAVEAARIHGETGLLQSARDPAPRARVALQPS